MDLSKSGFSCREYPYDQRRLYRFGALEPSGIARGYVPPWSLLLTPEDHYHHSAQARFSRMSAASPTAPPIVRSHSSSRRQSSYTTSLADRPHRAHSTATKPLSTPTGAPRPVSLSFAQDRTPSPSQQAHLATVARRDYDTTNVARPSSSRRSSSRDRSYGGPPPPTRTESTRSTRRNSSRGHSRYNSEMATNGGPTSVQTPPAARTTSDVQVPGSSSSNKRRTTISAHTGQWALGKTIGAGSMGKVKLAKNLETGEQVCKQSYS